MLLRFDPFRDLDRTLDEAFGLARTATRPMPMDAVRRGDDVEVRLDLPGVDPSSIDLTVERNVLTVSARRSWEPEEGDELLVRERPQGEVTRRLMLGETLDHGRIEAAYEHGVLAIRIPVAETSKPRKVQVAVGGGERREAIEASSSESSAA